MKKQITTSIVLVALAVAVPVAAQDAAASEPAADSRRPIAPRRRSDAGSPPMNLAEIRHHIYVMEGALARAVDYGAKQLNREILAVMPGVFMLEGEARARGVHLEGYGVFFDVRVPMMRQSMMWSLRMMLDQGDAANQAAINELRRSMQGITDPTTRASLEKAVRQLEARPAGAQRSNPAGRRRAWSCPSRRPPRSARATATGIPNARPAPHAGCPTASGRRTRIAPTPKPSRARSSTR